MLLLVKDEGTWRIVSQAWDRESPSNPIPAHLLRAARAPAEGGHVGADKDINIPLCDLAPGTGGCYLRANSRH
jgi:hypothetical protein